MYSNFRKALKQYRKSKQFTQEELAEELNVAKVYIGELERGKSSPSTELLIRFSKLSGVSLDEMFCPAPTGFGVALQQELFMQLAKYDIEASNELTKMCLQNIETYDKLTKRDSSDGTLRKKSGHRPPRNPPHMQSSHRHRPQHQSFLCTLLPLASVTSSALLHRGRSHAKNVRNCNFQPMEGRFLVSF